MNIEVSDEKLEQLVQNAVKRCVEEKVDRLMNEGKAYWFSQHNIENLTREYVSRKVPNEFVNEVCRELKSEELLSELSKCVTKFFVDHLYDL